MAKDKRPTKKSNSPSGFKSNKFFIISLIILLVFWGGQFLRKRAASEVSLTPSLLLLDIQNGEAKEVTVTMGTVMAKINWKKASDSNESQKDSKVTIYNTKIPFFFVNEFFNLETIEKLGEEFTFIEEPTSLFEYITSIFSLLLFVGFIFFAIMLFRGIGIGGPGGSGGGPGGFGKSRARRYDANENKITFADIAGQAEAKYELEEIVDFLKNPKRYHEIGARIPRGVLLVGMPGTGKTLMARAVAGEAGVNFFHMSGSDFVEMFVGVGASRVRDLFEQGRRSSPCIIFIDELDAVGRTRGAGYGGGHDEREQTLNQMLVEMDGFSKSDNVIVLAATNRPDVLDPALLRPGRFDRQVVVDMPDVKERAAIIAIHAKKIKLDENVDVEKIAKATPGSSGADLSNLVNEAALFAARKNNKTVSMQDFEEARDKILMGVAQRSKLISEEQKWAVAYHEAGHAILHYHLKHIDPLHKVTIIPRGRAAGVTFSLPEKDHHIPAKSEFLDQIKLCMGGYVAEEIFYGETTAGTSNDIKQATKIARKMVREWGMSLLGFISFGQEDEPIFIGREITQVKEYSEQTSCKIDEEINKIINSCLTETRKILKANKADVKKLATALVEKETLDDSEVRALLNLPVITKNSSIAGGGNFSSGTSSSSASGFSETARQGTKKSSGSLKSSSTKKSASVKGETKKTDSKKVSAKK